MANPIEEEGPWQHLMILNLYHYPTNFFKIETLSKTLDADSQHFKNLIGIQCPNDTSCTTQQARVIERSLIQRRTRLREAESSQAFCFSIIDATIDSLDDYQQFLAKILDIPTDTLNDFDKVFQAVEKKGGPFARRLYESLVPLQLASTPQAYKMRECLIYAFLIFQMTSNTYENLLQKYNDPDPAKHPKLAKATLERWWALKEKPIDELIDDVGFQQLHPCLKTAFMAAYIRQANDCIVSAYHLMGFGYDIESGVIKNNMIYFFQLAMAYKADVYGILQQMTFILGQVYSSLSIGGLGVTFADAVSTLTWMRQQEIDHLHIKQENIEEKEMEHEADVPEKLGFDLFADIKETSRKKLERNYQLLQRALKRSDTSQEFLRQKKQDIVKAAAVFYEMAWQMFSTREWMAAVKRKVYQWTRASTGYGCSHYWIHVVGSWCACSSFTIRRKKRKSKATPYTSMCE